MGTILGTLIGFGIGLVVYQITKIALEAFFGSLGGGNNYYKVFEWSLVDKSAWWIPNITCRINVAKLLIGLIVKNIDRQ